MPSTAQLQEIAENIENMRIGLDDVFKFKCHGCGKCCKNREDIILSPRDLFNIAVCLGLSTTDVIKTYGKLYIGDNSRVPLIRLIPRGQNKACPLLRDNRCLVHKAKPSVCALFPLGRFMQFYKDEGKRVDADADVEISYIINPITCGGHRGNTVRSWIESFGLSVDDQTYKLWTKTTMRLGEYIKRLERHDKKIPRFGVETIWLFAAELLYKRYDITKEFLPQFEANLAEMWKVIDEADIKVIQPYLGKDAE